MTVVLRSGSCFDCCRYDVCRYDNHMGSKDVNMSAVRETIPVTALCCPPLTAGVLDEDAATELAGVLKALADPVRLRLVSAIAAAEAGEVCACDLPDLLGRSQPT